MIDHPVTAAKSSADAANTMFRRLMFQYVSVGMGIAEHSPPQESRRVRARCQVHWPSDYKEGANPTQASRSSPHCMKLTVCPGTPALPVLRESAKSAVGADPGHGGA